MGPEAKFCNPELDRDHITYRGSVPGRWVPAPYCKPGTVERQVAWWELALVFWCEAHETQHLWGESVVPPEMKALAEEATLAGLCGGGRLNDSEPK